MDGPTGKMVHVGAELVVLLGVTFYLNGQIRSLKNEVRELRVKLEDQSEAVNKHLNNVYVVLDKLQNRPAFPGAPFHGTNPFGPGPVPAGRLSPWPAGGEPSPQRPARESQAGLRQRRSKPTPMSVPSKPKRPVPTPKPSAKHSARPAPSRPTLAPEPASVEEEPEEQPDPETLDEELKEELAAMEDEETETVTEETSPLYDDDEEEEEDGVSLVKALQRPTTDLSFVQAAIRQTPRRHPQKN
jgi:hypothetical protein